MRTRGVMISPAVREPNSTDRSISSAVSGSRVPTDAERAISEASSVELRAERSSSCGSMPEAAYDGVGGAVEHPDGHRASPR